MSPLKTGETHQILNSLRKIFLDLDGVIVNIHPSAFASAGVTLEKESDYPDGYGWDLVGAVNKFRQVHRWGALSANGFWSRLNYGFWRNLPLYEGARELVTALELYGEVYFVTTPTLDPGCAGAKFGWVREHFPKYRKKTWIGSDKSVFAAIPGAILIDDRDRNCDDFIAAGGQAILVPRPWNDLGYTQDPYNQIHWQMGEICS